MLRWELRELARLSGVKWTLINMIEVGKTKKPKQRTLLRLREAFEAGGVEFGPDGWIRLSIASSAASDTLA